MRIAFNIDCSDSYDEDENILKFNFKMGDGREINNQNNFYFSYPVSGKYVINVSLDDQSGGVVVKDYKINVRSDLENSGFLVDTYNNKVNDIVNSVMQRDTECQTIDIDEIQNIDNGECVTINSSVILNKGIFSNDYFYVNGAQIYYTKSDLTNIKEGNLFKIRGYISSNYGEKRIKLRNKEDIELIAKNKLVNPVLINDVEDLDYNIAKLVYVEGILKNKTKSSLLIDNNGKEFYVYIKDNLKINLDKIKEGSYVLVSGIVNLRNEKLKIFLRKAEDIKVIKNVAGYGAGTVEVGDNSNSGVELGAKNSNQENKEYNLNSVSIANNKAIIFIIGLVALILTTVLGFIVFYDKKDSKKKFLSYYKN